MKLEAYFRLMRFDRPIGTWLLWFPTAWALWIANQGAPAFAILLYFLLGTVFMRAAGCVVNDIADRRIDLHVKRTQHRPLATGEVHLWEAFSLLFALLLGALWVVVQLPLSCFYYALGALFVTILYPFCKRFLHAPQLVLGIAFSMGIPMAYAASDVMPNTIMMILFGLNMAWIVAYDTMYAMVDREDDRRIGVKSTALLFAEYDRIIICFLQVLFHVTWLLLSMLLHCGWPFYIFWGGAALVLIYQQRAISSREPRPCFKAFSSNAWYGLLMWLALVVSQ